MTSSAIEFPVSEDWAKRAWADRARYQDMYDRSIRDAEGFWGEEGKRLDWIKPYTKVKDVSYSGDVHIRWYEDGTLNACYNCVDRQLPTRADRTAILWEGDDPGKSRHITYRELHENVARLANVLKARGVQKGDRVTIYMPMIPEAAYAILACARIGAIHSVVFGGFSPDSLKDRKSVVSGKSVSVRVDLGGCRIIKKKKKQPYEVRKMN